MSFIDPAARLTHAEISCIPFRSGSKVPLGYYQTIMIAAYIVF
ncbi:hypothetical protein wVul_0941 [Wolbachia endosymbiont of Armadillidium vulgare str. wVulC]|nr:hypothetical protein wVul_0941 [Wolbachia endosymbiont of Armadillidium vulgare str. wVulC]